MTNRTFTNAVATLVVVAAAFSAFRQVTGQASDLNIHAAGHWQSDANASGDWQVDLAVDGNVVNGVIEVVGNPEVSRGEVRGSVFGPDVNLGVYEAGSRVATFSGSIAANNLTGRFDTRGGCAGTWSGSWKADVPDPTLIIARWPSVQPLVATRPPESRRPLVSGVKRFSARRSFAAQGSQSDLEGAVTESVTVGTNFLLNNANDAGRPQNEPEVAIDRSVTPNRLAVGANDYSLVPGTTIPEPGYYFCANADTNCRQGGDPVWVRGQIPAPVGATYELGGDPSLDFDAGGRAFYSGIYFNEVPGSTDNIVFVARALAGMTSFQNAVAVASSSSETTAFHDRPWLAANRVSGSLGFGNVYVCWQKFENDFEVSRVRLAVSTNAGSESMPMAFDGGRFVSDGSGTGSTVAEGCSIAVDLDGNPVILWLRQGNQIVWDKCASGGTSCGTDALIANIYPVDETLAGVTFPVDSFPRIAIDNAPDGGGYIAAVWAAKASPTATNTDIYYTLFAGGAWRTPVAIASEPVDEFFPAISFDDNHLVHVIYYKRTSQSQQSFNTFIVTTANGSSFSAPVQINDNIAIRPTNTFNPAQFIGDYIGMDSTAVRKCAWMDSRRTYAHPSNYRQDVYMTTVSGC